jgi:uncharacterized protein YdeI (BOF family)
MKKFTILAATFAILSITSVSAQETLKCDQANFDKVKQAVGANTMANNTETVARANEMIQKAELEMKEGKIAECEATLATVSNEFKM